VGASPQLGMADTLSIQSAASGASSPSSRAKCLRHRRNVVRTPETTSGNVGESQSLQDQGVSSVRRRQYSKTAAKWSTQWRTSATPIVSRTECMLSCAIPTSTVRILCRVTIRTESMTEIPLQFYAFHAGRGGARAGTLSRRRGSGRWCCRTRSPRAPRTPGPAAALSRRA
jgi:hypothetical protein